MKNINALLLLICFPLAEVFAQHYLIKGNVSSDQQTIEKAEVIFIDLSDTTKKFSTLTDTLGNYQLTIIVTSVREEKTIPTKFELSQNYPNPFSDETLITYKLNEPSDATIKIFNILGQEVRTLRTGHQYIGSYGVMWDGKNNFGERVATGVYLYQLNSENEKLVKKMIFVENALGANQRVSYKFSSNLAKLEKKINKVEAGLYSVKIKNRENTKPQILSKEFADITIQGDTELNFVVERVIDKPSFEIYFLQDTTLKIYDIIDKDLSSLVLQEKPWLSGNDIEFYDWSSHCIYLKKDKSFFFPDFQYYYRFPPSWTDKPWFVVADKFTCYAGYFLTESSINIYPAPYISMLEVGVFPEDVITSVWPFVFFHSDLRKNDMVKEALSKDGLYDAGIEIYLDSINAPIKIINNDTTTVEYTILIKNNSLDDLCFFDPDKTENEIFHSHNNGPIFYNVNTNKVYDSQFKKTKQTDLWDSSWYSLLKSGESVSRTIKLKGYPFIPSGDYLIELVYSCPKKGLTKNIRENIQGRYWLGETFANRLRLNITN